MKNPNKPSRAILQRRGAASVEMLLVLSSFVVAVIIMVQLGQFAIGAYFSTGKQLLATPFF